MWKPYNRTHITNHLSTSGQWFNSDLTLKCLSISAEWACGVQPLTKKMNMLPCGDSHRENINPGISANTISSLCIGVTVEVKGVELSLCYISHVTDYTVYWLCGVHNSFWRIWPMYLHLHYRQWCLPFISLASSIRHHLNYHALELWHLHSVECSNNWVHYNNVLKWQ